MSTSQELTQKRIKAIRQFVSPAELPQFMSLESDFGRYLYLPLDLPDPGLDSQKFKDWFNDVSKPIKKIHSDVAGASISRPLFNSVDSDSLLNSSWETNVRHDFIECFPTIREYFAALPFNTDTPSFCIWSSSSVIIHHRDEGPWFDLPCSFRYLAFDTNPSPTLMVKEAPTQNGGPISPRFLPRLSETRSFAWNNLRTTHASYYDPQFQKALLIIRSLNINWKRYRELAERSVTKYQQHALISNRPRGDFANI